jgi:Fe-S oxidoreductase
MAKLKYEFLAHYYKEHGLPLRNRLFGNIAKLSKLGALFAPMSNWGMNSAISKWGMEKFAGIDRRRSLPNFARETFEKWFAKHQKAKGGAEGKQNGRQVVLFHDTFMNYNYPHVGKATVELLETAGFEVILPNKRCCARPMISKGMIEQAKAHARYNVESLLPYVTEGIPVIGCEPSCLLTLRDDYPSLIPSEETELVAEHAFMVEEFLLSCHEKGELDLEFADTPKQILLHGHCHQRALVGIQPSVQVLSLPPGHAVEVIDSSCCGMAGSFGYETEHYDLSMEIGRLRLFGQIENQQGDFEVAVSGVSCREQIQHGTGKAPKHLIELLRDAVRQT